MIDLLLVQNNLNIDVKHLSIDRSSFKNNDGKRVVSWLESSNAQHSHRDLSVHQSLFGGCKCCENLGATLEVEKTEGTVSGQSKFYCESSVEKILFSSYCPTAN
jgi:hypothetical protein